MKLNVSFEGIASEGRNVKNSAVTVYLGGKKWLWIKKQQYIWEQMNLIIEIQPGFFCDKATYPFLYRALSGADKCGKSDAYSGLHDALYLCKGVLNYETKHVIAFEKYSGEQVSLTLSRKVCDMIAAEHMEKYPEDFSKWQIKQRYLGMRAGGGRYWRSEKKPLHTYFAPYAAKKVINDIIYRDH